MPTNSLHDYLSQQGAQFGGVADEQVAQNYGDTNAEHRALIESVALVDLSFRGCLAVLGDDRVKVGPGLLRRARQCQGQDAGRPARVPA
jgi:glycine cleavage system aminomethyltransferase T